MVPEVNMWYNKGKPWHGHLWVPEWSRRKLSILCDGRTKTIRGFVGRASEDNRPIFLYPEIFCRQKYGKKTIENTLFYVFNTGIRFLKT